MPERVVALVGPGTGPWLSTGKLQSPRLSVSGLPQGERLITEYTDSPRSGPEVRFEHESPNEFLVIRTRFSRVIYEGTSRSLLCAFIGG